MKYVSFLWLFKVGEKVVFYKFFWWKIVRFFMNMIWEFRCILWEKEDFLELESDYLAK